MQPMPIDYNWVVHELEVAPVQGDLLNVITTIYWALKASDGTNVAVARGSANLSQPNPSDFVAFEDVSKEWALQNVAAQVDVENVKRGLAQRLLQQSSPERVIVKPTFD
jgi:hypothetical protein